MPRDRAGPGNKAGSPTTTLVVEQAKAEPADQSQTPSRARIVRENFREHQQRSRARHRETRKFNTEINHIIFTVRSLFEEFSLPFDRQQDEVFKLADKLLGDIRLDNYADIDLDDGQTRINILLDELAALLKIKPSLLAIAQSHTLFNQIAAQESDIGRSDILPSNAPENWADRPRANRETCIDFAERVYRPWISQGMTLSDLRNLDYALYAALSKWIERNKDTKLPAQRSRFLTGGKEARTHRIKQELKELGIKKPSDAYRVLPNDRRRANRLYQAALRLQLK